MQAFHFNVDSGMVKFGVRLILHSTNSMLPKGKFVVVFLRLFFILANVFLGVGILYT